MKKNLYYRTVLHRSNPVKNFFFDLFTAIASWPRLLLEVFIRTNFGERYFSFSSSIIMFVLLAVTPLLISALGSSSYYGGFDPKEFLMGNITWYLFLAGFLYCAFRRRQEVKRLPSVFDFARFSLSSGRIHPLFYTIVINGKRVDSRMIETLFEPLFFFIIGFFFMLFGQIVGILIVVCSIVYSFSYMAAYSVGDNFVMDKIDELICNQELYNAFVDGVDPNNTRGVNYYGRRPADPEARRKVADTFMEEEETVDAM
ncbi:hypothetical protein [Dyadobacter pollutisoli]|jgi:hypothetical protein|uniref:Uncharacterized protein n=1 Tax=Dyadobacter pollutisoli TaxID=2910158 RepID=A0A9E8SJZ3_9BACT|nr:hypothetical protein [Dyadobacter pollutisoli]WAC11895.1 hypothetical protein ON006_29710 [Dyadobacter pollutisoli]